MTPDQVERMLVAIALVGFAQTLGCVVGLYLWCPEANMTRGRLAWALVGFCALLSYQIHFTPGAP